MTGSYYCSSPRITGLVTVENGIITHTPPVWYRWRGVAFETFKRSCYIDRVERIGE